MSPIVGVHGIAQQYRGRYELESMWSTALRDGLFVSEYSDLAERMTPQDLRVSFFGDLFRPSGAMSVEGPPFTHRDVDPGAERDFLEALYGRAVLLEPELAPPSGAMVAGRTAVKVVVDRLLRSRALAGVTERMLVGNVKQATAFIGDPAVKARVLGRLRETVTSDTRVLIGHSLGSIVAYEYLCAAGSDSPIELLVTMGSPLGIPSLVFDRLTPAPVDGVGVWPGSDRRWVNVSDPDDFIALRPKLEGLFADSESSGLLVNDRIVDNGDSPHAAQRYLNAKETGSAVGAVLGG
ncbi:hypothetical protein ACWEO2_28475 [Nocardia sp. NPDC004278]